jgi:hypothetical protein
MSTIPNKEPVKPFLRRNEWNKEGNNPPPNNPPPNDGGRVPTAAPAATGPGTTSVLVPVPVPLKDRMDATFAHTLGFTAFKSKRDFQRAAFEHFCAHLESTYNNGNQYPLPGQHP